jgi:AcrR family transcriptional regulator
MPKRTNRRDLIVQTATQLFGKNGYQATSTRQIAEAVGCTEAALYYHFKEGKRELLRAVMAARMPVVQAVLQQCSHATSLKEALLVFGQGFAEHTPGVRWLMAELPHLDEQERTAVLDTFLSIRQGLVEVVQRFVPDERQAQHIAWLMVCLGAGYQQLFSESAFQGWVDISMQDLMATLVDLMA